MSSLEAVVAALRRSDARSSVPPFLLHAMLGAAGWIGVVLLVTRLVPFEPRVQLAAVGIPVMLVVAATAWIVSRPGPGALMRRADEGLGLKERLSTAWERRASSGLMDDLLRRDALEHAEGNRLSRAFPIRLSKREAGVLAIVAAAAVLLAVLPNPMDQLLAQRRADAASQARAATAVQDVLNKIAASTTPADPKVQKILTDTQKQIRQAPDPRQALQAISPAEQQLLQLSDPQTPARTSTAQNLASSLSATKAGKAAGQALTASPSKGAQALRQLASQLQSLTPQERAQLAQALATAAQHASDPAMAASLQSASSALSSGDSAAAAAAAAAALTDLAGQLDSLQAQQNTDQQVASAINGLETARQGLAAQADRDAAGAGAASGNGGASPGASPGAGNGTGSGSGTGSGGSGGTGGTGASGSGSGSGQGAKPSEKLFVPGQPVPGQLENDPTPLGPGQDVPLTPYTQVVQAYRQAALDATNQSLIPGSEQDLVREYFSSLGAS